jgi:hypothetical protein
MGKHSMNKCPAHDELMFILKDIKDQGAETRTDLKRFLDVYAIDTKRTVEDISHLKTRSSIFGMIGGGITTVIGLVVYYFKSKTGGEL